MSDTQEKWWEVEVPNTSKDPSDLRPTIIISVKDEPRLHQNGVYLKSRNGGTLRTIFLPYSKVYRIETHEKAPE